MHIKNVQIADAINLRGLKAKLSKKKGDEPGSHEEPAVVVEEKKTKAPKKQPEVELAPKKKPARAKTKDESEVEEKAVAPHIESRIEPEVKLVQTKPVVDEPRKVVESAPAVAPTVAPARVQPAVKAQEERPVERPVERLGPVFKPAVKPEERLGPVFRTESKTDESGATSKPQTRPQERPGSQSRGTWREVPAQQYSSRPPYDRQSSDRQSSDRPYSDRPRGDQGGYQPRGYQGGHQGGYQGRPSEGRFGPGRPGQGPGQDRQDRGGQDRPPRDRPYPPRTGAPRPGFDRRPEYGTGDARRPAPFRPQPFTRTGPPPAAPKDTTKALERGARTPEKKETKYSEKETRDVAKDAARTARKGDGKGFDARIRHGFVGGGDDEEQVWRKKRPTKGFRTIQEQEVVRPSEISVRLPISVKDLAQEMKLKASELISKLFLQGQIVTLNDMLDDETMVQLLGHEFGCEVHIDKKEAERIRITDKTIKEEIGASDAAVLQIRPPVVAFMGHVDHGKTSLIDAIRKTNRVKTEVGAITQHIGAFQCHTASGDITILDTPGHEAFSHMRERGAEVTDIVVLVVAGDEGMKQQTFEALEQALESKATILVAINKCDKPNFDAEQVYRQLAEKNLLPECWGGQTITVNCSAVTGQGIKELLEMLAIQAEVLEIRANPETRARGTVIESQMDKGLGPVATVLVQNGTLRVGDCLVFGFEWARIKTMRDQDGSDVEAAGPSAPVRINGLSGLPESGEEFIVVENEKEAREISNVRREGKRQSSFLAKKRLSFEGMVEKAQDTVAKKVLTLILRADVQGSSEALKNAIMKIDSDKVEANIISTGVGLITESDVQRAQSSKATIIGFHTQLESHLESLVKELGVAVRLHDIIYHAVDDVKDIMKSLLDKIKEEQDTGKAEVKALFKSSQLGIIAGCQILDGTISRNSSIRVKRGDEEIWKGPIMSLKRHKDDVREASKGMECGILLQGFTALQEGDVLEAFDIHYLSQDL